MVNVTIDGLKLEVQEGTTVLRAAQMAGVSIPTLCDHPDLTPYGGCRLCLVQVEGARALQPSCTLPASSGMVVHTDTPEVHKARRFMLSLLFSERNHFCMYCQMSGGDCELQNAAYDEYMTHWPLQPYWQPRPVDASHEYMVLDHNRCILCRRCVRACGELAGNFTLAVRERGANSTLVADLDLPWGESSCVACGSCLQVCPTGAIIDRMSAYRGRETDVERTKTTCVGCSIGCGVELIVRDNHLLRIEGNPDAPVNEGVLCKVGRFLPLIQDQERVVTPMVRKNGSLESTTWEEALDTITARLVPLKGRNGDGVAALASTRLSVEALHIFKQLFVDRLGSDMVTSIEEGVTTHLPGGLAEDQGWPLEGNINRLKSADCVVAIGVDLVENHQVAGFFVKRALPKGTKLIVIDPYNNGMSDLAHYTLRPQAGTDADLLLGIMAAIVNLGLAREDVSDLVDIATHAPETVSRTTGITPETIRTVGHLIASSQRPVFVYGKGITRQDSPQALKALIDLARLVGALDAKVSALISTKGQANSLTAHMLGLDKVFETEGHKAVYLALGDDKASQRLIQRLEAASFVAVQASYMSPVTAKADVVLPVEMWAEQEGHFLNLEGRLQGAHKALIAPAGVRSNVNALQAVADKMGFSLDLDWKKGLGQRTPINSIQV